MLRLSLAALGALLPAVLAQSCTDSPPYRVLTNFVEPNACVPGTYFQAIDKGQITRNDLVSQCEITCTNYGSRCLAYVGILNQAADSQLTHGTCFFYSTIPTSPVPCADHPDIMVGEFKGGASGCLLSSSDAATAFCSSYLSIGAVTSYTSTSTPLSTTVIASTSTKTGTSRTITTTSTTETSTISRTTRTTDTLTATSVISKTSVTTTSTTTAVDAPQSVGKRDGFVPTPSCLLGSSSGQISAACSCVSISSSTIFTVSIAPTSTVTSRTNTRTTTTTLTTSTRTRTTRTRETDFTTLTSSKTRTTRTTTSTTSTKTVVSTAICAPSQLACGEDCVDHLTDKNNCGTCGNVCEGENSLCSQGVCVNYLPCGNNYGDTVDNCEGDHACPGNNNCLCWLSKTLNSGVCLISSASCPGQNCDSDNDCSPGQLCIVSGCCDGGTACTQPTWLDTCLNGGSARRLFRSSKRMM